MLRVTLRPTMGRFKILIITALAIIILILIGIGLFAYFQSIPAGISIETTPEAQVYLDGVKVGRTPYEGTLKPKEVVIKLVPESEGLVHFEAKVSLAPKIKTIIRRDFGETEEASAGEIISFEKSGGNTPVLAAISIPDSIQISIDGTIRGFTPYKTTQISEGTHQITFSADDYKERTINDITPIKGYKLTLIVKLAKNKETTVPTPTPEPIKQTMVEILSTDTGFLRVRSEPGPGGKEVGQVKPGEKYLFLEEDEKTGWFKIELNKEVSGWVSNQFAKKVDEKTR